MAQIEVNHLIKEYKRKKNEGGLLKALGSMFHVEYEVLRAVDDISFSINKGESVGYVGPNGSGKSTTIKMLCGILHPTAGTILINGMSPQKERVKNSKKIGVVFGNRSLLWWDVPVIESYRLFQKLYEIPEQQFRHNIEKFTEIMGIGPLLNIPERQLSLGQKMRCNIAAAFLHNPEIVYLDEPTIGLDSESKASIRECIRRMNEEEKTTFIVTSHDFQDIETLCRRIILINRGKVVLDDDMQKVKTDFNKHKQIQFEVDRNPWYHKESFAMEGVRCLAETVDSVTVEYDVTKTNSITVMRRMAESCEIQDVSITGRDIEAIISDIIKRDNKRL